MLAKIANKRYSHMFTRPKIASFKKFKSNILYSLFFTEQFCLLALDEIHLIKKWDKDF